MANTYTKIYVQAVFAVNGRQSLLSQKHRPEIFRYMAGILDNRGHKSLAVNGMADHVHLFFDFKPKEELSKLIQEIKKASNTFIKERRMTPHKFSWQKGYGAFSYGYQQIDTVINYVINQEEHHKIRTFRDEYMDLIVNYQIDYKDEYVFEFL